MLKRGGYLIVFLSVAVGAALLLYLLFSYLPSRQSQKNLESAVSGAIPELHVGFAGGLEFTTLDPAAAVSNESVRVLCNIYDRLVDLDEESRLVPMIASKWESSSDLKEWTFWIRGDLAVVSYRNGQVVKRPQPLSPDDVVFSISRALMEPSYGRTLLANLLDGAEDYIAGKTKQPAGLLANSQAGTITFRLSQPFAFLPERLTTSFYSVVGTDSQIDYSINSNGTGPYVIASWDKVRGVVDLVLNPYYWHRTASAPTRVRVQRFSNEALMLQELAHGNLHYAEIDALSQAAARKYANVELRQTQDNKVRLIAINLADPIFRSRDLRLALNLSVNRTVFEKAVGGGRQVAGPVPEFVTHSLPCLEYDPNRARNTLSSSGYSKQATKLSLLVENTPLSRMLAEFVVKDWRAMGIQVETELGQADFIDRLIKGKYQLALAYYGSFVLSPEPYLWPYLSYNKPIPNVMGYENARVDGLYQTYIGEASEQKREAQLKAVVTAILEDAPAIWLFSPPQVAATPIGVNFRASIVGIPQFTSFTRSSQFEK